MPEQIRSISIIANFKKFKFTRIFCVYNLSYLFSTPFNDITNGTHIIKIRRQIWIIKKFQCTEYYDEGIDIFFFFFSFQLTSGTALFDDSSMDRRNIRARLFENPISGKYRDVWRRLAFSSTSGNKIIFSNFSRCKNFAIRAAR